MSLAIVTFVVLPQVAVYVGIPILLLNLLFLPKRASLFEATLPINAREMVLARVMAVSIVTVVPLLVWSVSMSQWLSRHPFEMLSTDAYGPLFWSSGRIAELALAMLTLAALPFTVRPNESSGPPPLQVFRVWGACGAVCAAVIALAPQATALLLLLFFVTAALHRISTVVPEGFQTVSLDVDGPERSKFMQWWRADPSEIKARWLWPVVRSTIPAYLLINVLAMTFVGYSGVSYVLAILILGSSPEVVRSKFAWMTRLPIPARARVTLLLTPTLLAVFAYGIGAVVGRPYSLRHSLQNGAPLIMERGEDKYGSAARIPLEYWARVKHDSLPEIVAPWGEKVTPFTVDLKLIKLYNPYTSRRTSSKPFVDWQFSRATTAVYGAAISRARYATGEGLPQRLDDSTMKLVLTSAFFLLLSTGIMLFGEMNRTRATSGSMFGQIGMGLVLVSPAFIAIASSILFEMRLGVTDILGNVCSYCALYLTQTLHASVLLVILAAVALLGIEFRILEWKFRKNEVEGVVMSPKMLARAAAIRARLLEDGA